jgi:hypothetical protein
MLGKSGKKFAPIVLQDLLQELSKANNVTLCDSKWKISAIYESLQNSWYSFVGEIS